MPQRFAGVLPIRTLGKCDKAEVKILNPRRDYDKRQRKHGPGGKFSEQRIVDGLVRMRIEL